MHKGTFVKRVFVPFLVFALLFTYLHTQSLFNPDQHVVYAADSVPLTLKYDDFQSTNLLQLNGDSVYADYSGTQVLRLNESLEDQFSSAFTKRMIKLENSNSFSTYFVFRISDPATTWSSSDGGEGLTYTIQADPDGNTALGRSTAEQGTKGISLSLSIEFDTYDSGTADPNNNHIGINTNGSAASLATTTLSYTNTLDNGSQYHVWIDYDGATSTIEIRFNKDSSTRPAEALLTKNDLDLSTLLGQDEVYAGFTASTGGAYEDHSILKWYFNNEYNPIDINANTYLEASILSVSANPQSGSNSSTITATVTDSVYVAVQGIPVTFSTDFGTLSETVVSTDINGQAVTTLSSDTTGNANVVAVADSGVFSSTSVSLVASTDAADVIADRDSLEINFNGADTIDSVTQALNVLPDSGANGTSISWTSDAPDVLSHDGQTLNRPTYSQGDTVVNLTATISKNLESDTKVFSLTVKALPISAQESIDEDYTALTVDDLLNGNVDENNIISDLTLPTAGENSTSIAWETTNEDVIDANGTLTRPSYTTGDVTVTLTGTVSKAGGTSNSKTFDFVVKALPISAQESIDADYTALTVDDLLNGNVDENNITSDLTLPTAGENSTSIAWETTNAEVINATGTVTRPSYTTGDVKVTMAGTVSKTGGTGKSKTFDFIVKALPISAQESIDADYTALTIDELLNTNVDENNITSDLTLPTAGENITSIAWETTNAEVINETGTVTRPSYTTGDVTLTLTGTVSKAGGTAKDKTFDFVVKALPISAQESIHADYTALTIDDLLNGNVDGNNITSDLTLPTAGENITSIAWKTTNQDVINTTGAVTRPSYTTGDVTVTLTAAVSKAGGISKNKTFEFVVKAQEITNKQRVDADFDWLKGQVVLNGNPSSDNIKTDLSFPTVGPKNSSITWRTSKGAYITAQGVVNRPSALDGNQTVEAWAVVNIDDYSRQKYFIFNVIQQVPNDQEAVQLDYNLLDYAEFIATNTTPFAIDQNLDFPSGGKYGTAITWDSSQTDYITEAGVVKRPVYELGYQSIQLTAHITKGSDSMNKTFVVSVKPLPDAAPPTIISYVPADGEEILNSNTAKITFNENIKINDKNKIQVKQIYGSDWYRWANSIDFSASVKNDVLTIEPIYSMQDNNELEISIKSGAVSDEAGNLMEEELTFSYKTRKTYPSLVSEDLLEDSWGVPLSQVLKLEFRDDFVIDESKIKLSTNSWNAEPLDVLFSREANTLIITPKEELEPNTYYKLSLDSSSIVNLAGNSMKESFNYSFRTERVNEINLVSPVCSEDVYIFGDYIRFEFDQLIEVDEPNNYYYNQSDLSYFVFGKCLYVDKSNLEMIDKNGKSYYKMGTLDIYPTYSKYDEYEYEYNDVIVKEDRQIGIWGRGWNRANNILILNSDSNTGSIADTPVAFGQMIDTPEDITLDYGDEIQAEDLSLISVENIYGRVTQHVTARIDGTRLIITPNSGEWEPNKEYILKVPQGALQYSSGEGVKRMEYPFITPIKYDYSDSSIYIQHSKIPQNSYNYINASIQRKSHTWDSEDEYNYIVKVTNTKTGEVIQTIEDNSTGRMYRSLNICYEEPGVYEVVMQVLDNGYTYEFKESFEVVSIDRSKTTLTVDKNGTIKTNIYTDFENKFHTYAYLKNGELPLLDRKVTLKLIGAKSGKVYYTKTVSVNSGGRAGFTIDFTGRPIGKYKVVFSSPETDDTCMYYVDPKLVKGKSDLVIYLYDNKTKKLIRSEESIDVNIDNGSTLKATRQKNGLYILKGVTPGEHELKVSCKYYNAKTITKHLKSGMNKPVYYLDKYIPNTKISVSSSKSNYVGNSSSNAIFIDGVNANISFETNAYWNGHQPGQIIYEFYNGKKTKKYTTTDGKLNVNVGKLLGVGTRGRVYAVSKDGSKSDKRDMNIEVASKPSYCYASYSDSKKQYFLNYNFSLENIGSLQVPEDWPLIGGEDFELDVGTFQLGGVMERNGKIKFVIGLSKLDFEAAKPLSNYKEFMKDYKSGSFGPKDSDIGFSFDTNQEWQYDTKNNKWKYVHGDYTLYLEGEASYTQYFTIVIIPCYLKGVFGVEGSATLNMDVVVGGKTKKDTFKYSGEIVVEPSLEIVLGAGVSGLNVEGFFKGAIETGITIPEWDFTATGKLTGGVRASAFLWSWEKKAIEYEWVIEGEDSTAKVYSIPKVTLASADFDLSQLSLADFTIMDRDAGDSEAVVVDQTARDFDAALSLDNDILLEDISDFNKVDLISLGDDLLMVWPQDNANKTSSNRTELKYAINNGSQWEEGAFLNLDATADFNPVLAEKSGVATLVWQDLNKLMDESSLLEDYIAATELSVIEYDGEAFGEKTMLTDDEYYDFMPKIAYTDDKTCIVWIKNKSNDILSPEVGAFEILYAENSGQSWSESVVLETELNQVVDVDMASDGNDITILYTIDRDGDILTSDDREMYSKQLIAGEWSESLQITDDQVQDGNVRVFYSDGQANIVWIRDGILSKMNLSTKVISSIKDISAQSFEMIQDKQGITALSYISKLENGLQSINAIFYDNAVDNWSEPVQITQNDKVNSELTVTLNSDDELVVTNRAAEKIVEQVDGVLYTNVGDANIEIHKMQLQKDLKVSDNSICLNEQFTTGVNNEIAVTVENSGHFTVDNFEVAFYDDQMNLIGTEIVDDSLLPGEKVSVSTMWNTPEVITDDSLTVVVDPDENIADAYRLNNSVTQDVITSDVSIESYTINPIENNKYLLEATLANYSSVDAQTVTMRVYGMDTLIGNYEIDVIEYGMTHDVVMEIDTNDIFNSTDSFEIRVEVDVMGTFKDINNTNDRGTIQVEKQNIVISSTNILDSAQDIPTDTEIEVEFSNNIQSSDGYNDIILIDFDGTPIAAAKEIVESKLIVKPDTKLSKGTYYTLAVPQNAFTNEYKQTMNSDVEISFVTDVSDISVVGTYPFNGAKEIASTDNISVQFNTNILEGEYFSNISLLKNGMSVPTTCEVDENRLVINPTGALRESATYKVFIPLYSVKDQSDSEFESSYEFSFTTAADNGNEESSDRNNDSDNDSDVEGIKINSPKIDTQNIEDTEDGFVYQAHSDMTTFNLSDEFIGEIRTKNKKVIIRREDITLNIKPDLIAEKAVNSLEITSELPSSVLTHKSDTKLSTLYTLSANNNGENIEDFDNAISVNVKVDLAKIQNAEKCGVFYQAENGEWVAAGGVIDTKNGVMEVNINKNRPFVVVERNISFDDTNNRWSTEVIEVLSSKGIIKGRNERSFDPLGDITRAEFTTLMVRSLFEGTSRFNNEFEDIKRDDWYAEYIAKAVELNLVNGVGDGKFAPDERITREQMMVIANKLYQLNRSDTDGNMIAQNTNANKIDNFEDLNSVSQYAKQSVDTMIDLGIVKGKDGKIVPKDYATREEASTIIYNLLKKIGKIVK